MMDISKNFFEFIGLPVSFDIDQSELADRSRELQKTTLRSPLLRAQYLLLLQGIDTESESSTPIAPMFVMQQMELRERLEEIPDQDDPYAELEDLLAEVEGMLKTLREQFAQDYREGALTAATEAVRKMQFLEKLVVEIERLEDRLDG